LGRVRGCLRRKPYRSPNNLSEMTTQSFLEILDALCNDVDPRTGEHFERSASCLGDAEVRSTLIKLTKHLLKPPTVADAVNIPDSVITTACNDLRTLGYEPSIMQLAKVFIGSRSIVDRNLKGLPAYNRFRGIYTRQRIYQHLTEYQKRFPTQLRVTPASNKRTADEPWREIPFFDTDGFDKLADTKATELYRAVIGLGLRKANDRLPEYMAKARINVPRAFEPWTREEQALLIEAMCYTNDAAKLADIFGRSASSLIRMGKRLIYESQLRQKEATLPLR